MGNGRVFTLKKFIDIIIICCNTTHKVFKETFGYFAAAPTIIIKVISNLKTKILNTPDLFFTILKFSHRRIHNLHLLSGLITKKKTAFTQKKIAQRGIQFA